MRKRYRSKRARRCQRTGIDVAERQAALTSGLDDKEILIAGAGGVGTPVALVCGCHGYRKVEIADHDVVTVSNLSRQTAFSLRDLGRSKAHALARYAAKHTHLGTEFVGYACSVEEVLLDFAPKPDVLVALVDNDLTRKNLCLWAHDTGTPAVFTGVSRDADGFYVFAQVPGVSCLGCYRKLSDDGGGACEDVSAIIETVFRSGPYGGLLCSRDCSRCSPPPLRVSVLLASKRNDHRRLGARRV